MVKKYHKETKYFKKSKNAQEAHEACRPTNAFTQDVFGKDGITSQQNRLYKMIWTRTIASQMAPAELEIKTVKINPFVDDEKSCKKIAKAMMLEQQETLKSQIKELESQKGKENDIKEINDKIKNTKVKTNGIKKTIEDITFVGKHEKILFDGFLKASGFGSAQKDEDDNEENDEEEETVARKLVKSAKSKKLEALFEKLKKGDVVSCFYMNSEEKFTKPPHARYTEASLVKN